MAERQLDLIIQHGTVVFPEETRRADIGIADGIIVCISDHLDPAAARNHVDAEGLLVMAGVVDMHVHFNEPGFGHWEGFASGSAALAAGGCTVYGDMPLNGNPPTVSPEALDMKSRLADGSSAVDYAFWGGLIPGNEEELVKLSESGVIAFKAFMSNPGGEGEGRFREVSPDELLAGMSRIAEFGGILALHAESETLTQELTKQAVMEGKTTAADYAATRPEAAETEAVAQALAMARKTGCRLHFVHISSPQAVDLIEEAKHNGMDVTLETCPHYLAFTEEDITRIGPAAKCAPPLRSRESRDGLWQRLQDGKIDFLASDHSPSPESMKRAGGSGSFFETWGGIAGGQSTLEVMLEEGWRKRGLPLNQLTALLSLHPAKRFGLHPRKGEIRAGADADLVLVDPKGNYILDKSHLLQKHPHSPYIGKSLSCRVTSTYSRGQLVYALGRGILLDGKGIRIRPGDPAVSGPGEGER